MKKVLHITNWYPNIWDDLDGIFVKEQFKVFSEVTNSYLINLQVREGKKLFEYKHIKYSDSEEGYYLLSKIKSQKIIEIMTTFLLLWVLMKSNYKKYDLLHFHIAYPLLTYYSWWKKIIKIPILISEHWSAYHFNFYMPKETKKLERVKNIFKQNIPLITVSKALLEDIRIFSGSKNFPSIVIPNVIDFKYFHYTNKIELDDVPVFFIVNIWRSIKNPFPMLEAFSCLASQGIPFQLNIGGDGPLLDEMKQFIKEKGFESQVSFLGKMNKKEISIELNRVHAYLYSSEYETFSIVCAQALASGCPLIGPPIPAIMEYSDETERVNVQYNNVEDWQNALKLYIANRAVNDNAAISNKAQAYFSTEQIKNKYVDFLNTIVE